jgi:hypothetical protein
MRAGTAAGPCGDARGLRERVLEDTLCFDDIFRGNDAAASLK